MKQQNKEQVNKSTGRVLAEAAGWYGMSAIVGAYALVSFQVIAADSVAYQLLNLSGAAGLLWISVVKRVGQTVALNLFWASIALVALMKVAL